MLHWVAPTIISLGLVLGIGLAVGHHLYYQHLDETVVTDQFQQTWAIRYGSIFAIATRICFSASLSTSIVQLFWNTFRKPSKTTTIETVDYLFDITRNPLGFFSWRTWAFSPLLVLFGLIAWLLPIIVVVAPATLTVVLAPGLDMKTVTQAVPEIDWTRKPGNFCEVTYSSSPDYYGPHIELQRLALSTANSGALRTLVPAQTNSSYELTFYGPSLQCNPYPMEAPQTGFQAGITISVARYNKVAYFATAPLSNTTANMTTLLPLLEDLQDVPKANHTNHYGTSGYTGGEDEYYTGIDRLSTDAARFWVFVNPLDYPKHGLGRRILSADNFTNGDAAVECKLYNSSYQLGFNFSSGTQTVTLKKETKLNTVAYVNSMSYHDVEQPQVYPNMNYQAVMHAVTKLLMGWLEGEWDGGDGMSGPSQVPFTSLVYTEEFDDYRKYYQFINRTYDTDSTRNRSIAYAVEDMMRNVTFSLFTSSRFLKDTSPPIPVTVGSPQNMWRYAPTNLAVVYGVAALLTALGTLAGWASLGLNGWAAFANSPSTIVRASRGRRLDALVRPRDTRAAAPLPAHLAGARVHFVPVGGGDDDDDDDDGGGGGGGGGGVHVAGGRDDGPGRWAITPESVPVVMVEGKQVPEQGPRRRSIMTMKKARAYSPVTTDTTHPSAPSSGDRFEQFQESWEGYSSQYDAGYHPSQYNAGQHHSNQYGSGGYGSR